MSDPIFHMIAGAPRPVAPFSHAVEADGWVFVTGQMPDSPDTPGVLPDDIIGQTKNCLSNLETVLASLGLGLEHAMHIRIYLSRFQDDYEAMNATYATYFPEDRRPARTTIGVTGLAYNARIEIDLIAKRP